MDGSYGVNINYSIRSLRSSNISSQRTGPYEQVFQYIESDDEHTSCLSVVRDDNNPMSKYVSETFIQSAESTKPWETRLDTTALLQVFTDFIVSNSRRHTLILTMTDQNDDITEIRYEPLSPEMISAAYPGGQSTTRPLVIELPKSRSGSHGNAQVQRKIAYKDGYIYVSCPILKHDEFHRALEKVIPGEPIDMIGQEVKLPSLGCYIL